MKWDPLTSMKDENFEKIPAVRKSNMAELCHLVKNILQVKVVVLTHDSQWCSIICY